MAKADYKFKTILKFLRVNNQIRIPRVQVIDEAGAPLGEMDTYEALRLARDRNLDLVEVGPNVRPPICKIIDYGKYQYAKAKKERERRPKKSGLKNVRLGFRTSTHDLSFKASQVDKFLKKGHKVRIELRLRGREHALKDLAREKLKQFVTLIAEPHKFEQEIKLLPFGFTAVISREK